jgi:hypothetical protein
MKKKERKKITRSWKMNGCCLGRVGDECVYCEFYDAVAEGDGLFVSMVIVTGGLREREVSFERWRA